MNSVTFKDRTYTLDRHGFLDPPEQWDEDFAEGMAKFLGIHSGLTESHWRIIRYLRHKFLEHKTVPVLVTACADNNTRLSEFRGLFPTGYHRGACRIAGINYQFMYQHNYWLTYETAPPARERYELTQSGFLKDAKDWDEDFVPFIVNRLGMPEKTTDRHMEILKSLRNYYEQYSNIPTVFDTCQAHDLSLGDLKALFPSGYRRGACRLAGLPFFA